MRWAAPLLLVGCSPAIDFVARPGAPAEVEWMALVESNAEESHVAPFVSWPNGSITGDGRPGIDRWLLGYTSEALEPFATEGIAGRALALAADCAPGLPPATWCAQVENNGEISDCESVPAIRFAAFDASQLCDPARLALRTGCGIEEVACSAQVVERDSCHLALGGCSFLPAIELRFDGRGAVCVDTPTTCRAQGEAETLGRVDCRTEVDDCWLELHEIPTTPRVEVTDRLSIVDLPLMRPADYTGGAFVGAHDLHRGYLRDLAIDGDTMFVASTEAWGSQCPTAMRISVRDPANGSERLDFAAPDCVWTMVADPRPNVGVLALTGQFGTQTVRRFDANGTLTGEAPVSLDAFAPGATPYVDVDLVADADGVYVLLTTADDFDLSFIIELDPETLAQRGVLRFPPNGPPEAEVSLSRLAVQAGALFVVENVTQTRWLDPSGTSMGTAVLGGGRGDASAAFIVGDLGVAALFGERPQIALVRKGENGARVSISFEQKGAPTAIGPWPASSTMVAVATLTDDGAFVAPLDLVAARHLVGGAHVSAGPIERLLPYADGLWTIGTWSGELIRLRAR